MFIGDRLAVGCLGLRIAVGVVGQGADERAGGRYAANGIGRDVGSGPRGLLEQATIGVVGVGAFLATPVDKLDEVAASVEIGDFGGGRGSARETPLLFLDRVGRDDALKVTGGLGVNVGNPLTGRVGGGPMLGDAASGVVFVFLGYAAGGGDALGLMEGVVAGDGFQSLKIKLPAEPRDAVVALGSDKAGLIQSVFDENGLMILVIMEFIELSQRVGGEGDAVVAVVVRGGNRTERIHAGVHATTSVVIGPCGMVFRVGIAGDAEGKAHAALARGQALHLLLRDLVPVVVFGGDDGPTASVHELYDPVFVVQIVTGDIPFRILDDKGLFPVALIDRVMNGPTGAIGYAD